MITIRRLAVIFLCSSLVAYASSQGNTFDRVRYNGGTISNPVDPKDWGNQLTVTSDLIVFTFKNGQKAEINPKSVTSLSYGQEAHRRVGTMIALAILVAPVALFGLFHKTRLHYIGIQFKTADGKSEGLLLQGDKDNYRAILVALQSVTGVPVSVAESDRGFIPVGVTTAMVKNSEAPQTTAAAVSSSPTQDGAIGIVNFASVPDGAEIYVDDNFVGDAPATLKLNSGKHIIVVRESGYQDWQRELVISGGTVNLNAKLVAGASVAPAESAATRPAKPQDVSTADNDGSRTVVYRSAGMTHSSGWIGVTTKDDASQGVVITRVLPDSSASQAGLQEGDIIIALNGKPVNSGMAFDIAITRSTPGSQIRLGYMRGGSKFEVTMIVGKIG
jgi:PDZ domain/PEGA domain